MDASSVQQLKEGFGPEDTLDYRYETLVDITTRFYLEENETLKEEVRDILVLRFKDLIFDLQSRINSLKPRLVYIVER